MSMLFIINKQQEIINRNEAMKNDIISMKKLQDNIVRSQAKYATSNDIDRLLKNQGLSSEAIKKDLKNLKASIKAVSTSTVNTPGYIGDNLPSTYTTKNPTPIFVDCKDGKECLDRFGYLGSRQGFKLNEPFSDKTSVSWGEVGFSAWKGKPWDLKVYKRKYRSTTVISTNEDGRHFSHTQMTVEVNGKKVSLPISNSEIVEKYPESHFMFNPRLYFSVDGGVGLNPVKPEGIVSFQFPLFSYGKTKVNTSWTFVGLGLGYHFNKRSIGLILAPVSYNIGKPLPFVDNMYIGPSLSVDIDGKFSLMAGLRVGL
jgi:hypothetical protein